MVPYSIPSVYYDDVKIEVCYPDDSLIELLLMFIINECDPQDHIYNWYKNWARNNLWYCAVATVNGFPISIAGAREDGKVLCYLYTLKDYRIKYRGIPQMDFMRVFVDNAKTETLYMGVHAFTKKHEKLARSYNRQMFSGVPRELQPYAGKWKYEGVQTYRNVDQHIHRLYLNELNINKENNDV